MALSSITELEFNLVGLIASLFSTFIFAVQNIMSKKVAWREMARLWMTYACCADEPLAGFYLFSALSPLKLYSPSLCASFSPYIPPPHKVIKQGVDHIAILLVVSRLSLLALLPAWFLNEGYDMVFGDSLTSLGYESVRLLAWLLKGACPGAHPLGPITITTSSPIPPMRAA